MRISALSIDMSIIAIASFTARKKDELSFKSGDVLKSLDTPGSGKLPWLLAELDGQQGFVPRLYFRTLSSHEKTVLNKKSGSRKNQEIGRRKEDIYIESRGNQAVQVKRCSTEAPAYVIAHHSFLARSNNEITFDKGDKLKVIDIGEEGLPWLEAELNGRTGFVPRSYFIIPPGVVLPKRTRPRVSKANVQTEGKKLGNLDDLEYDDFFAEELYEEFPETKQNVKCRGLQIPEIPHPIRPCALLRKLEQAVVKLTKEEWNDLVHHRGKHVQHLKLMDEIKKYPKAAQNTEISDNESDDFGWTDSDSEDYQKPVTEKVNETDSEKAQKSDIKSTEVPRKEAFMSQDRYLSSKSWYTTKYVETLKNRELFKDILLARTQDGDYRHPDGAFIVAKNSDGILTVTIKHGIDIEVYKILSEEGTDRFFVWVVKFESVEEI